MNPLKFKRVVVASVIFTEERKPITQLMQAEYPEKDIDLRVSGGHSDIGLQYEIERGSSFFVQEVEYVTPYRLNIISESELNNPTVEYLRYMNQEAENFKNW